MRDLLADFFRLSLHVLFYLATGSLIAWLLLPGPWDSPYDAPLLVLVAAMLVRLVDMPP